LPVLGHEVLTAESGEEGLKVAAAHDGPIDLLLTDVVMPRMDGPDLYKELLLVRPEIKAIFISGYTYGMHLKLASGIDGGETHFMAKPVTPSGLTAKISQVMGQNLAPRSEFNSES